MLFEFDIINVKSINLKTLTRINKLFFFTTNIKKKKNRYFLRQQTENTYTSGKLLLSRQRKLNQNYLICTSFKIAQCTDHERMKGTTIVRLVEELPVRVKPIGRVAQNGDKFGTGLNLVDYISGMQNIGWRVKTGINQGRIQQIPK